MTFRLYQDAAGEWRWTLRGRNGEPVATSGEGYTRKADAERAIRKLRVAVPFARVKLYLASDA